MPRKFQALSKQALELAGQLDDYTIEDLVGCLLTNLVQFGGLTVRLKEDRKYKVVAGILDYFELKFSNEDTSEDAQEFQADLDADLDAFDMADDMAGSLVEIITSESISEIAKMIAFLDSMEVAVEVAAQLFEILTDKILSLTASDEKDVEIARIVPALIQIVARFPDLAQRQQEA